ncbi:hypothetical protein KIS1582_1180 [Cytobacillus firmus]|uniref:Uncharacterized protein n=1 Tax=Cytobacillus firmus TaxID=1399 RepID=A0A800NBL1_CYTFI|nr:hypothetical protein KIS1582_1180 [Cytobacillus firmus]
MLVIKPFIYQGFYHFLFDFSEFFIDSVNQFIYHEIKSILD